MASEEAKVVPHEDLCDQALAHYGEISNKASWSNSLVPKAIEYYKRWRPQGERKLISLEGGDLDQGDSSLSDALEEGWVFDPWLNPRGNPITIGQNKSGATISYWVLVKGTPEQIAGLEPFANLPKEEEEETTEPEFKPYGLRTLFIAHGEKDSTGAPKKPPAGFVVMHKDHIFAKGTVYTKVPTKEAQ